MSKSATAEAEVPVLEIPATAKGTEQQIKMIPVKSIEVVDGHNPRTIFEGIDELAESIAKNNLINPLLVSENKPGVYRLLAGERRLRAVKKAGLKEVPCVVREGLKPTGALVCALIENGPGPNRQPLTDYELANGLQRLKKSGMSIAQIAHAITLHPRKVRRLLEIIEGPKEVVERFREGVVTQAAATELARLDPASRKEVVAKMEAGVTADQIRQMGKEAAKARDTSEAVSVKKQNAKKSDADRTAQAARLVTWMKAREINAQIQDLCHTYVQQAIEPHDCDVLRGAIGALLHIRGSISSYLIPDFKVKGEWTDQPKGDRLCDKSPREAKQTAEIIKAEAASAQARYDADEKGGKDKK